MTSTRRGTMLIVIALWCCLGRHADAADPVLPDNTLVAETETERPTKPDEKERRVKLTAGLAALAGITIIGIVFGAMIIIWAGRLRRMAREPVSATGRQDPFWFLRPEKITLPNEAMESDTTPPESS